MLKMTVLFDSRIENSCRNITTGLFSFQKNSYSTRHIKFLDICMEH